VRGLLASPQVQNETENRRGEPRVGAPGKKAPTFLAELRPVLVAIAAIMLIGGAIWLGAVALRGGQTGRGDATTEADERVVETTSAFAPSAAIVTDRDIERLAAQAPSDADARDVVRTLFSGFWRDVQFQNYPGAYRDLSADLRRDVPYAAFVEGMRNVRWWFFVDWAVHDVVDRGGEVTIFLEQEPRGELLAFTMKRNGSNWMIAADPANALHPQSSRQTAE